MCTVSLLESREYRYIKAMNNNNNNLQYKPEQMFCNAFLKLCSIIIIILNSGHLHTAVSHRQVSTPHPTTTRSTIMYTLKPQNNKLYSHNIVFLTHTHTHTHTHMVSTATVAAVPFPGKPTQISHLGSSKKKDLKL